MLLQLYRTDCPWMPVIELDSDHVKELLTLPSAGLKKRERMVMYMIRKHMDAEGNPTFDDATLPKDSVWDKRP